ncbi:unnamed protein product [Lasius platythorax]|uniref:Uncharacterized protein n=1 Tax=Lasius platythorax TaxID=488582 RepID=A0AAV2PBH2_9HYME
MLTRTALNPLSWNLRGSQIGVAAHELPPTDVYWLRLSPSSWRITDSFPFDSPVAFGATIVVDRARVPNENGNLAAIPRAPVYIYAIPFFHLLTSLRVLSCLSLFQCWRYGIAPNLFPRPATAKPTLYHEVSTTRGESGSLFAGNDTDRPDFVGLHPG